VLAGADRPMDAPTDFAEFYSATVTWVLGLARRTAAGDHDLAWDATQEAYARMLERWPDRRRRCLADNRRYTSAIAVNLVVDAYRRHGRSDELDDAHDRGLEDSGFAAVLDELALLGAVRDFLHRQPARRRAVGVLYLIEGLQTAEVAGALGMTESTVRTHVERLRVLLKPYVDRIMNDEQGGGRP
jgi:RNA polymerase sigma factor (sigma-70 family)